MELSIQVVWLFVLALPIACISWTVTHEEVFKEPRDYCILRSRNSKTLFQRKIFYLFTCEYCFSHYVTALILIISQYELLLSGWRGFLLAEFALVWIANIYMSLYGFLRQDIKKEKAEISSIDREFK